MMTGETEPTTPTEDPTPQEETEEKPAETGGYEDLVLGGLTSKEDHEDDEE